MQTDRFLRQIRLPAAVCFTACLFLMAGCTGAPSGPTEEGKSFLLSAEPSAAENVVDLKSQVATGLSFGETTIVGRVGGGKDATWDVEHATFLIRDLGLKTEAHDHGDDHECQFCQAEKAKELESMALVRIVDSTAKVIATDARVLLGVQEDQVVVAQGTGSLDESGTFVFDATKVFIRP